MATAVMSASAADGPAAQDRKVELWAASCAACHGSDGKAQGVGLRLAGLPAPELFEKLKRYRDGTLQGTVMPQHAKGYSEAELRALANYFARVR